ANQRIYRFDWGTLGCLEHDAVAGRFARSNAWRLVDVRLREDAAAVDADPHQLGGVVARETRAPLPVCVRSSPNAGEWLRSARPTEPVAIARVRRELTPRAAR